LVRGCNLPAGDGGHDPEQQHQQHDQADRRGNDLALVAQQRGWQGERQS
jgi:hypothetical protein